MDKIDIMINDLKRKAEEQKRLMLLNGDICNSCKYKAYSEMLTDAIHLKNIDRLYALNNKVNK